jgi:hypothetical protein
MSDIEKRVEKLVDSVAKRMKLAKLRRVQRALGEDIVDEFPVRLNATPTYDEIEVARVWIHAVLEELEARTKETEPPGRMSGLDMLVMERLKPPFGCEFIRARGMLGDGRWRIYDANDDAIASVAPREEGYARLIAQALNDHFAREGKP